MHRMHVPLLCATCVWVFFEERYVTTRETDNGDE